MCVTVMDAFAMFRREMLLGRLEERFCLQVSPRFEFVQLLCGGG